MLNGYTDLLLEPEAFLSPSRLSPPRSPKLLLSTPHYLLGKLMNAKMPAENHRVIRLRRSLARDLRRKKLLSPQRRNFTKHAELMVFAWISRPPLVNQGRRRRRGERGEQTEKRGTRWAHCWEICVFSVIYAIFAMSRARVSLPENSANK